MNTNLLRQLIDLGDTFEQQHPDADQQTLTNFLTWADNGSTQPNADSVPVVIHERYDPSAPALPVFIVEHVNKVYEYFKLYMKKACASMPLLNYDDFIVLVYLAERGSMTKTQMIETTVNEKTSGMLVIKRLIDNGFVSQTDNPNDRRSRCITITDAGMAILNAVQDDVNQAMRLLVKPLSDSEQMQFARLLNQLNQFHEPLFLHHREDSLAELMAN